MSEKKTILVLCGGQSTEHEVSILSASNVMRQLSEEKYTVSVAYILRNGRWCYFSSVDAFLLQDLSALKEAGDWMQLLPGSQAPFQLMSGSKLPVFDCVFPVLHGTNGEDGVIQGLLDALNVPAVGPDVLGAAIAMHKDVTKELMQAANLPVVPWVRITRNNLSAVSYSQLVETLGSPFFVKANSLGSSVAVYKVSNANQFDAALAEALQYDACVLVEKAIVGREIECSVLGNEKPVASLPGEIINHTEFYSYAAKYLEENAATVQTPADLPEALVSRVRQMAIEAFTVARCQGMARIDFFLTESEALFINEINAIPGFTDISMYPKNWEVSGLSQTALFDKLIQLAIARFNQKKQLKFQDPAKAVTAGSGVKREHSNQ